MDIEAKKSGACSSVRVSPGEFLAAFKYEWEEAVKNEFEDLIARYKSCSLWTDFMLGYDGFLPRVMRRLNNEVRALEYKREYYTLDALYVGGEDLFGTGKGYPSELHVLIEHEHGFNVEEEMWKLIFWRSPLKIIILYDWGEEEKTSDSRRMWLDKKIEKLTDMLRKANDFLSENDQTEYLFIAASLPLGKPLPSWCWASDKDIMPVELFSC